MQVPIMTEEIGQKYPCIEFGWLRQNLIFEIVDRSRISETGLRGRGGGTCVKRKGEAPTDQWAKLPKNYMKMKTLGPRQGRSPHVPRTPATATTLLTFKERISDRPFFPNVFLLGYCLFADVTYFLHCVNHAWCSDFTLRTLA